MESKKYRIESTKTKGRSLFASSEIKAEEVVFEEAPLVSSQFSWNKAYGYLACDYCMFPLETAEKNVRRLTNDPSIILPYPEADPNKDIEQKITKCHNCFVMFCNYKCWLKAKKEYHDVICSCLKPNRQLDQINEIWKKMHYPPETTSVLIVFRIFAMIRSNPDLLEPFSEFCDQTENKDLSLCHKLLGEKFSGEIETLQKAFHQYFGEDDLFSKFVTLEAFTHLFALLGTNAQGIGTSSFATWVKNVSELEEINGPKRQELDGLIDTLYMKMDEVSGQFLNNEGSGLYLKQSKINHSCKPNAEVRFPFSNNILQIVALRDIAPNEEIFISYLDECQLNRSRHSRQKFLQENYLFLCDCEKCQEEIDQPDETSEEDSEEGMDTNDEDSIDDDDDQ